MKRFNKQIVTFVARHSDLNARYNIIAKRNRFTVSHMWDIFVEFKRNSNKLVGTIIVISTNPKNYDNFNAYLGRFNQKLQDK